MARLVARCTSSRRSPAPAKITWWSPTASPPRNAAKPISPVRRGPGTPSPARRSPPLRGPARPPARRRVVLAAMVHFHDLDVPIGAEPPRDLLDEPQKQIDPETHVRRPDDRDNARGLADRLALLGREAGCADHHRLAEPRGKRGIGGRSRGGSEVDHHIAVADQLLGAVADRNTGAADTGQFADIVVDMGAARPGAAAG